MSPDRQWKPLHIILFTTTRNILQPEQRRVDSSAQPGGSDDAGRCETSGRRPRFNAFLLLFAHRQPESCVSTRSARKSGLENRVLESFGAKLVLRKTDCPVCGGKKCSTSGQSMVRFFPLQAQFIFLSLEYYITAASKMKLQQEKKSELQ